jgi:hypothetical protein
VLVGVRVGLGVYEGEGVLLGEGVVVGELVGEGCGVEVLVIVELAVKAGALCAWLQPVIAMTSRRHETKLTAKRMDF